MVYGLWLEPNGDRSSSLSLLVDKASDLLNLKVQNDIILCFSTTPLFKKNKDYSLLRESTQQHVY